VELLYRYPHDGKRTCPLGKRVSVKPFPPSTSGDICVKMKAIFFSRRLP
jgi:hypothetical protein